MPALLCLTNVTFGQQRLAYMLTNIAPTGTEQLPEMQDVPL